MQGKFFWGLGSLVAVIVVLNLVSASGHGSANQPVAAATIKGPATSTFEVTGMTCKACELPVRQALGKLPGVQHAVVSYDQGNAIVTYDPAKLRPEQITAAIETTGYKARRTATCAVR